MWILGLEGSIKLQNVITNAINFNTSRRGT